MKALEKDRERRYETANGFAADIERYLHDQPVEACPPSTIYRLKKFIRRNKLVLFAGGAIAGALIVGTAVSTWQAIRATRAEAAATVARGEAETNYQKALSAVDEMLSQVGQESLADIPQVEPVRRALLEKALLFYQGVLKEGRTEPRVRLETARAYQRVSEIYGMLGAGKEDVAFEASEQAISILKQLMAEFPQEAIYQEEAARCYQHLARLKGGAAFLIQDNGDQARKADGEAFVILKKLAADHPEQPRYGFALARGYAGQARGMWGEREPAWTDEQLNKPPADASASLGPSLALVTPRQRYEAAEKDYRQAIDIHEQVAKRSPQTSEDRASLGRFYEELSVVLRRLRRMAEAERALRLSLEIRRSLLGDFPAVAEYRGSVARSLYRLGLLLNDCGQPEQAERAFRDAAELQETLVADFPGVVGHRFGLTFTLDALAQSLRRHGTAEAAQAAYARAADAYRPAVYIRETAVREFPKERAYRTYLIAAQWRLGNLLMDAGRVDEAVVEFRKALLALERAAADFSDEGLLGVAYCRDQFILATAYSKLGNKIEARAWYDKAVEWMDKSQPKNEELLRFRAEAAELLDITESEPESASTPTTQQPAKTENPKATSSPNN
jgi:tetratricopeptide (TPR) repeat protein